MSATTTTPPRGGASGGRTRRAAGRAARLRAGLGLLLLVATLATVAALTAQPASVPTDPASTAPDGGRALAQVLRRHYDVQVTGVDDTDALAATVTDRRTTLLVSRGDVLSARAADAVAERAATAGRLVLVEPTDALLARLGVAARESRGAADATELVGACATTDVGPGDRVSAVGSSRYRPRAVGAADVCLVPDAGENTDDSEGSDDVDDPTPEAPAPDAPTVDPDQVAAAPASPPRTGDEPATASEATRAAGAAGAYLRLPATASRPETVILGRADVLTNAGVLDDDGAAIALRTLRHSPRLVWFTAGADAEPVLTEAKAAPVVPAWFVPALAVLAGAALALCLWRGRRLGRLAREPLPVVVPAVETLRARAQLYARAHDPQAALRLLQDGAIRRLRRRLALPPHAATSVVAQAAAGAAGRDVDEVLALLTETVTTDPQLATSAAALRRLEREVSPR